MNIKMMPFRGHGPDVPSGPLSLTDTEALIQLTKDRLLCDSDLDLLTQQFLRHHTVRLPQLLHSELMQMILRQMERGTWVPFQHGEIGRELLLDSVGALAVLRFVTNTPDFLNIVERITQCGPISTFAGRVYRMVPGTDHCDSWHTDACDNRLVGMSLNLGYRRHCGGMFQLRKKGEAAVLCELPNLIQGDAILFRISSELEHRITPMKGTDPKTAFAGWFRSGVSNLFSQVREVGSQTLMAPGIR